MSDFDPLITPRGRPYRRTDGSSAAKWIISIVVAAVAITALVVGSISLRNTNEGLIGTIANLYADNVYVSGDQQIDGNLQVGGTISKKRQVIGGNITALGVTSTVALLAETVAVSGTLTLQNASRRVLYVGPTRDYKNVSQALATFNGLHAGDVQIFVDPGVYVDNIEIGGTFSASFGFQTSALPEKISTGVSIFGDNRVHVGITYISGATLRYPVPVFDYKITTSTGRTFDAVGATYDTNAEVLNVQAVTVDDGVPPGQDGCSTPFANAAAVVGKAALVQRGTCGFLVKSQNAAANGAAVTILYQNNPNPPVPAGGGPPGTLPGVTVMISAADALILQNDLQSNPTLTLNVTFALLPPFGAANGNVTFSHPSGDLSALQIDVTGTNPNFTSLGVVPGDNVTVVVPSDGSGNIVPVGMQRIVASVSDNVITFTTPLTLPANVSYASITFLPNVQIMSGNAKAPVFSATSGSGVYLEGVAFVANTAFVAGEQVRVIASYNAAAIVGSRIVVDMSQRRPGSAYQVLAAAGAVIRISDRNPIRLPFYTTIFTDFGSAELDSIVTAQYVYAIAPVTAACVADSSGTVIVTASLQAVNGNVPNLATNPAIQVIESSKFSGNDVFVASWGSGSPYIGVDDQSTASFSGTTNLIAPKFPTNVAVSATNNAWVLFGSSSLNIANIPIGLVASGASSIVATGAVTLTNVTVNQYVTIDTSTVSVFASVGAPLNVVTYTTGTPVINNAFETQIFNGGGTPLAATLNPAATFGSSSLYQGKRFYFTNSDGAAHTIKLTSPAVFEYPGGPATANTFTFAAVNGTTVTMFVTSSTRVQVENPAGGSFSFVAKRHTERSQDPSDAAYLQYLESLKSSNQNAQQ